jgi:hypothetical protein
VKNTRFKDLAVVSELFTQPKCSSKEPHEFHWLGNYRHGRLFAGQDVCEACHAQRPVLELLVLAIATSIVCTSTLCITALRERR